MKTAELPVAMVDDDVVPHTSRVSILGDNRIDHLIVFVKVLRYIVCHVNDGPGSGRENRAAI